MICFPLSRMFFTYTAATSDQFIPRHVTPTCPRVTALVESSSSYAVHNNNTMVRPFLRTFSLDPTNDSPIHRYPSQSALFNFQSLLLVILLLICTCTYIRAVAPRLIDSNKQGCVLSAFLCNSTLSAFFLPPNARKVSGDFSDSCAHPRIVFSGANCSAH